MGVVRPSGPLPSRVYWRRRLVVLGVPVLVLALLVWLVAGRGSSDAKADPGAASSPHPSTTAHASTSGGSRPSSSPTPTATAGGVTDCGAAALAVTVVPGATRYAAGVSPAFTVTITNVGTQACLVDAGDAHRAVVVSSGKDRVWSSQDCSRSTTASRVLLLPPGGKDAQRVVWNRVRTAAGCPANLPAPKVGSYKVAFTVGGATAKAAKFRLA
ncbi:hypothetical protein [Cellulomonas alba]|uniref:DUF4232 domain-containing protein n=1 Tax=Cellulomonas alba TaxID=3053467 RepID=A0ABT7SGC8_9CELL|nr:hypothetical protein [Cellulomonas alba]MDM7855250.1 hypothetical protein [Cellulomonas alba]